MRAGLLIATLLVAASPAAAARIGPPIDVRNLERTAHLFDRIFDRGGLLGAKAHSRACHKAAARTRSWSKRDSCAAFDLAMADMDLGASLVPDRYFQYMKAHQADQYRRISTDRPLIRRRLRRVLEIYTPYFLKVMRARIAGYGAETRAGQQ